MYVLMGSNGNITSKAARLLLQQGKKARVIGRDAAKLKELKEAGAEIAVGDALDAKFLEGAFRGAEAVYTMIPPKYDSPEFRAYQNQVGESIAKALTKSGVKRGVNLSSVGASLPDGTGPIAGLHDQEERLNNLEKIDILHLRAAYFMENHFGSIPAIKQMGAYPGLIKASVPVAMIATRDIAERLVRELTEPSTKGHEVRHVLGPRDYTMSETARILGAAIGKPDLAYVEAPAVEVKKALRGFGFSQSVADSFEEMSRALGDGRIARTYKRDNASTTPTTLEEFAKGFAAVYKSA
ncbi:MAG TPA: NmrA family NAD(P)-binding protein [Planctomycetota bacterium]|nr:NmrA family NAD(P)-binding protein [Planctomycetota bacterium]